MRAALILGERQRIFVARWLHRQHRDDINVTAACVSPLLAQG